MVYVRQGLAAYFLLYSALEHKSNSQYIFLIPCVPLLTPSRASALLVTIIASLRSQARNGMMFGRGVDERPDNGSRKKTPQDL